MRQDRQQIVGLENVAWEYFELRDFENAASAAQQVIIQDPDAIDAYLIIAETTVASGIRSAIYREAIRIGETLIGDLSGDTPDKDIDLWGGREGRSHLRVLHRFALFLWGENPRESARDEAIRITEHALRLAPSDNQGFRTLRMEWLARQGEWVAALAAVRAMPAEREHPENAMIAALIQFRVGDKSAAEALLEKAHAGNPLAIDTMLNADCPHLRAGKRKLPAFVDAGSPDEALICAVSFQDLWRSTPGAIDFLERFSKKADNTPHP